MVLWSVANLYFDVVCFTVLCEVAIWRDVWIIHFTFTSEAGVSIQLVNDVSSRRVELCLSSSPWAVCHASIHDDDADDGDDDDDDGEGPMISMIVMLAMMNLRKNKITVKTVCN